MRILVLALTYELAIAALDVKDAFLVVPQIVIQRGGSFLSGSFRDPIWAEDCAGRATVCLTRSISYTVLISPLEMMGMFGMAQVIGAKSLGINVLTDKDTKWPPPKLTMTQQQIIETPAIDDFLL